jgi:hypothetical protein
MDDGLGAAMLKATTLPLPATGQVALQTERARNEACLPENRGTHRPGGGRIAMKARLDIRIQIVALIVAVLFPCFAANAQNSALKTQLEAQYKPTKTTDDRSDIVTAGSVLILQKDKIIMYSTTTQIPPQNSYKDGKLSEGVFGVHQKLSSFGSMIGHPPPASDTQSRQFVTGEKFWVTRIDIQPDGVLFTLFSDPYNDIRYYSTLKFVFPHGSTPTPDQVLSLVGEVLKVDADDSAKSDDKGADQQQAAPAGGDAAQQPAADQAAAAPAAPPAPPATVEIGQSTDEVVAILGQPEKILNLGPKQIYVYKDLKVTFVKGKVTDAQ